MIDVITLAIAEKYTRDTAIGLGAVKGAPCTISKTETVSDGTEITFKWTGDDGSTNTRKIKVIDGISVVSAVIDSNNHLILELSDGNTIDCGEIPIAENAEQISYENTDYPTISNVKEALDSALSSGAKLEQSLTVSNPVGSAHILNHRELFTNSVTDGKADSMGWVDSTIDLMNECMVYGHIAFGSHPGYETGIERSQLPLFAMAPEYIPYNSVNCWLRTVASSTSFADVSRDGHATQHIATNTFGVRPVFGIIG